MLFQSFAPQLIPLQSTAQAI